MRTLFLAVLGLSFFAGFMWAGGGPESETRLMVENSEVYFSPSSDLPEKRSLKIQDIKLKMDPKGVIKYYRFSIYDRSGRAVFEYTEENLKTRGVVESALGIGEIPKVTLPKAFEWKGTDSKGTQVADGSYFYQLVAVDSWGQTAMAAPLPVVLDTKAPAVQNFSLSTTIISPDGDGKRDTLTMTHQTGPAQTWQLQVLDKDGKAVFDQSWKSEGTTERDDIMMPGSTEWKPEKLAEGTYTVKLSGMDRAGNSFADTRNLVVSYAAGGLTTSVAGAKTHFNPVEGVEILTELDDERNLQDWYLEVVDSKGRVWRKLEGKGRVPASLKYFGTGIVGIPWSDAGRIEDGLYRFRMVQNYTNGSKLSDDSLTLSFDTSVPEGRLELSVSGQLPGSGMVPWFGSQRRPSALVQARLEDGLSWFAELRPRGGERADPVHRFPVADWLPAQEGGSAGPWNGTIPGSSQELTAGVWILQLMAVDEAGNIGRTNTVTFGFQKDVPSLGQLSANAGEIDPWTQTEKGGVLLEVQGFDPSVVAWTTLSVKNEAGEEVLSRKFAPTAAIKWRGEAESGLPVADGAYDLSLVVSFMNGDEQERGPVSVSAVSSRFSAGSSGASSSYPYLLIPRLVSESPAILLDADTDGTPFNLKVLGLEGTDLPWKLSVEQAGKELWTIAGKGPLADGRAWQSPPSLPATPFTARLELPGPQDSTLSITRTLTTALPVQPEGKRLRIVVPDILFDANLANTISQDPEIKAANIDLMKRLGAKLKELDQYRIVIEGHAAYAWATDAASMKRENERELIPLSRERAQEVQKLLYVMGVPWERTRVEAKGGAAQTSPQMSAEDRQKFRKVIIWLEPL